MLVLKKVIGAPTVCCFCAVCVVWMGVDAACQTFRSDGEAEGGEYSGDQIKDERDSSTKVKTLRKTEQEAGHPIRGRERKADRERERERERESGDRSPVW